MPRGLLHAREEAWLLSAQTDPELLRKLLFLATQQAHMDTKPNITQKNCKTNFKTKSKEQLICPMKSFLVVSFKNKT